MPGAPGNGLSLLVHTDQAYRRDDAGVSTARAFVTFVGEVGVGFAAVRLLGRLDPQPGRDAHPLPDHVRFVPLPWYASAAGPVAVPRAVAGSLRTFWRALPGSDVAWLMGPSPLTPALVVLATLRRTPVVLGIRQDLPAYVRARHPRRRALHLVADALDGLTRLLARRVAVVAVGPTIAARYRRARALRETSVSLVRRADVREPPDRALGDGRVEVLTVSRLDEEKNPLLLADVLERLPVTWHLTVCGDGPLEAALGERLRRLGVAGRARMAGYLTPATGLGDAYRRADVFLHVSHTEGVPQVLFEAFAAGIPVVATDVGGVAGSVGDSALLVPPDDAEAAAFALRRIAHDPQLRAALVGRAHALVLGRTLEAEAAAVAGFVAEQAAGGAERGVRRRRHRGGRIRVRPPRASSPRPPRAL